MKKINKLLAVVALMSVSASSFAASKACRQIQWHDSKPVTIYADLYKHVHIKLPSNLVMEPVNINNLWQVSGRGKHLFIAPTSEDKLGKETTLSALTEDEQSYDFVVKVDKKRFNACVNITNKPMLSADQMTALTKVSANKGNSVDLERENRMLKTRYRALQNRAKQEKTEAVKQAVRKYRYSIYTRYEWKAKKSRKSFMSHGLLSDVYDDGRFTYIRLTDDNKTLPALQAMINGKPEFIESKYDEVADLYRVVGIYPELSLIYGDDSIDIKRVDKNTRGEF